MSDRSGHYLKIPFIWDPTCPSLLLETRLVFYPVQTDWLVESLALVLATSLDPADQTAVRERGAIKAAADLIALSAEHFEQLPEWWQVAQTQNGQLVGFTLCSLFAPALSVPREGTIFYLGVLPKFRGNGYGHQLLNQATRTLQQIGVGRIACDTAACNAPMIAAFRKAGYVEQAPWERPLR